MAAPPHQEVLSTYPDPPSFYRLYADGPNAGPPPPPSIWDTAVVFGHEDVLSEPFVPPLDVPKLYEAKPDGNIDFKRELLKLNSTLLFLYIDALGVLTDAPDQYASALTPVVQTLQNMQHLLNLLRPLQARHTLEHMLHQQVQQKQEALAALVQQTRSARQLLATAATALAAIGSDAAESSMPQHPLEQPPSAGERCEPMDTH